MTPHAHNRRAAFTLIELLAVVLIIGLLITLGIAGYAEMRKHMGVGTAARHVADHLALARQTAMAGQLRTRYIVQSPHQSAVLRETPTMRSATGGRYWQWILEWQRLPVGVSFLQTNLPPTIATQVAQLSAYTYGNVNPPTPPMTGSWNQVTGSWQLLTTTVQSVSSPFNYPTIEFSPEGRPSQTLTVTVGRTSRDSAFVIVDGLTGRPRIERN